MCPDLNMNSIFAATGLAAGLAFASGASVSFDDEKCGSTCGASQPRAALASNDAAKNIVETAVGNEDFSTLVTLVGKAQLVDTLASKGPFTVFAPNNAAFQKLLSAKGKPLKLRLAGSAAATYAPYLLTYLRTLSLTYSLT